MAVKQKQVRPVVDGTPWSTGVRVKNSTGATIAADKLVYFSGITGKTPTIAVADADTSDVPARTLWVTRTAIPDGSTGHVLPWKVSNGFSGLTAGLPLYMTNTGSVAESVASGTADAQAVRGGVIVGESLSATTALIAPGIPRALFGAPRVETITPGGNGSAGSPTRTLVARDSGTTYFFDISTYHVVIKLPAPLPGMSFKFVASRASDGENSKDLIITTNANGTNFAGFYRHMGVAGSVAAGIVELNGNDKSTLKMDTSTSNAPCSAGDFIEIVSDGTDWMVNGVSVYNNLAVTDDILS